MKKHQSFFKYIYQALFILITAFIFFLAAQPATTSSNQSGILVTLITSTFEFFKINLTPSQIDTISILVRKLIGHFSLFGLDGIFAHLTFDSWMVHSKKTKITVSLVSGLLIASISEIIQLFAPERGPSFYDVLLDFAGFILGVLSVLWIQYLLKVSSLKKTKG